MSSTASEFSHVTPTPLVRAGRGLRRLMGRRSQADRDSGSLRASVRTRPGLDFSLTGLVYCSMMMFMGLAAINSQANLLFAVFGLMIGVLLSSGVISRLVLRNVEVRRTMPDAADVGRPCRIRYDVVNRKRWWPSFSLTLAELDAADGFDRQPHAYVLHSGSGMSAAVSADVIPVRRGHYRFDRYQLSSSFPFGFIKRAVVRHAPDELLVRPPQGVVESTVLLRFPSARSAGLNQRPREGGADEFFGVRDYRAGDPPRMIHWRRSASAMSGGVRRGDGRTGLVVKQLTRVAPPRLVLLVDTYAPPPPADPVTPRGRKADAPEPRREYARALGQVERNLAAAATLVEVATRRGLSVGLVIWSGRQVPSVEVKPGRRPDAWYVIPPDRSKRHARDLLAALAEVGRNDRWNVRRLLDRGLREAVGDTTAVLVTGDSDASDVGDVRRSRPGRVVVVDARPEHVGRWMQFEAGLDFAAVSPHLHTGR